MSKLKELRARHAEQVTDAKTITDLAASESRDLTPEETADLTQRMADIEATEKTIEILEKGEYLSQKIGEKAKNLEQALPSKTQPSNEELSKGYTLSARPAWDGREDMGYRNGFEFCKELIDASMGKEYSERLHACCENGDVPTTLDNPKGGALVPAAFLPRELRVGYEDPSSFVNTTQIPMGAPSVKMPALIDEDHRESVSGGFKVTRKAEGHAAIVETLASYRTIDLDAKDLFGFSAPTRNLLSDSVISFAAIINRGMREEFPSRIMEERLRGTGIGEYLGVLNSGAYIQVKKGGSQAAETIIFENIAKMRARIFGYSRAVWMANQDVISDLILLQHPTNATMPIWIPSARPDIPDILFGRPLVFTEHCSSIGETGDLALINWEHYLEGTLQGVQQETSLHARFFEHDAVFKFWTRNDGAPWWTTTMKPKHGKNTLSPFIGIEARK